MSEAKGEVARQRTFGFKRVARKGKKLGRKKSEESGVSHTKRPVLKEHVPMHITLKLLPGLKILRGRAEFLMVVEAVRSTNKLGLVRIVHFSVQADHIHMICEAANNDAMAKGMNGLTIRVARGFNRVTGRKGQVFSDRFS